MNTLSAGPIRTHRSWRRPSSDLVAAFREAPTGNVSDAVGSTVAAMSHQIRPLTPGSRVAGPALTVWTRGGDNLAVWKVIDAAKPGDVIVVATGGHVGSSTFGELLVIAARNRGVVGIVTDGMCRDAAGIRDTGVVTFAAGTMPSAPDKRGPGEIGGMVRCGGVEVNAGDVVVADDDGVVVVPLERAEEVAGRLAAVQQKERVALAELAAGRTVPSWVDAYAEAAGIELIE